MTGFAAVMLLAAACWLVRLTFIAFVPAEWLPGRITAALAHVTPSVLAALISVETLDVVRAGSVAAGLAVVGSLALVGAVARRRPSPAVTAGLGVAAVALIDVVLVR